MTSYKGKILFVAVLVMAFTVSAVHAQSSVWEVNDIAIDWDDGFMTETGAAFFDTPWVQIKGDSVNIASYFAFRNIDIPNNATISAAYLELTAPFPPNFSQTLLGTAYGLKKGQLTSWVLTPDLNNQPQTTAFTTFDLDTLVSGAALNVTVTNQVIEIFNQFAWTTGNDMAFKIATVAVSGGARYQVAYETDPSLSAELYIEYLPSTGNTTFYKGYSIVFDTGDYSDFTAYTEIDTNNDIYVVNANTLVGFGDFWDNTQTAQLYLPLPVEIDSYEMTFDLRIHNMSQTTHMAIMSFGNSTSILTDEALRNEPDYHAVRVTNLAANIRIIDYWNDAGGFNTDAAGVVFADDDTQYYYTVSNDGTNYRTEIYDDAPRTNLIGQMVNPVTGNPVYGGTNQTFYAFNSPNGGVSQFGDIGFTLQNLLTDLPDRSIYVVFDENGTRLGEFDSLEDAQAFIDGIEGQTPDDPNPPGTNYPPDGKGALTRFNMRFYVWLIGWVLVFIPPLAIAYKSYDFQMYLILSIVEIFGWGLIWSIASI